MHKFSIFVTGQYEGFHSWKEAPENVAFLRNLHRHLFKWRVDLDVSHSDRELEFFIVKRGLEKAIKSIIYKADCGSCESQASQIFAYAENLGYSCKEVTVSEDGENGATVRYV